MVLRAQIISQIYSIKRVQFKKCHGTERKKIPTRARCRAFVANLFAVFEKSIFSFEEQFNTFSNR